MGIRLSASRRVVFSARVLALSMAFDALVAVQPVHGAPADIFDVAAPAVGSEPPKAADIQSGDTSVAGQTGAFDYNFPISVPPGRNGMQPHLALTYSSQSAIYGGIANGWSLPLPIITADPQASRLALQAAGARKQYVSSMAGGRVLVPVTETANSDVTQTYRAQNDATFTRYELVNASTKWRARTTDGLTYYFGDTDHVDASRHGTTGCTIVSDDYAPLTRVIDSFGSAVDYYYEAGVDGECRISLITWGENAPASIADFASVAFTYSIPSVEGCVAGTLVGAQTSYRTGTKIVTGASELDAITATAYAPGSPTSVLHTRVYNLSYADDPRDPTASCTANHAAYRSLYSIAETAWHTGDPQVALPAIKFSYASAQFGVGTLTWNTTTLSQPPWGYFEGTENRLFNLGWGYRFLTSDGARWPTVEAMLLDIDGDGRLDRIWSAPQTDNNGVEHCHAFWERNTSSNQSLAFDGIAHPINLPTLKWASANFSGHLPDCSDPNLYAGSPMPDSASQTYVGVHEACALNYQRTNYTNSSSATWCSGTTCANGTDNRSVAMSGPLYLSYRWVDVDGDGLVDLIASPTGNTTYNLQQGNAIANCPAAPPEPALFGDTFASANNGQNCPSPAYHVDGTSNSQYTMCAGMFPWFVYLNHGGGVFGQSSSNTLHPLPDTVLYEPMPLESDTGDASMTAAPNSANQGIVDLDGDGFGDATSIPSGAPQWGAYRNDKTGRMLPSAGTAAFAFGASMGDQIAVTNTSSYVDATSTQGLLDINGDGLADHWVSSSDASYGVFELNTGSQFTGTQISVTPRPGNDYLVCPNNDCPNYCGAGNHTCFMDTGDRIDTRRTLDLDLDGRPDVVDLTGTTPACYLNEGSGYSGWEPAPESADALKHHAVVWEDTQYGIEYLWELRSDLMDLDGDGIPETVDLGGVRGRSRSMTMGRIDSSATAFAPPRLLVSIDNQRGATTTVGYAPLNDTTTVSRSDGNVMPHTQWVVKSLTTSDSFSGTNATTSYQYTNPHFSAEGDLGLNGKTIDNGMCPVVPPERSKRYAFRGFDQVTTTAPSGAKTVQRYDYSVDWSGRLVTSLVIPAEAPSEVRSIDETTWQPRYTMGAPTCGYAITTYHATEVRHWTCRNGQSETACRANTDTFERTVSTTSGLPADGARVVKETSARLTTDAASNSPVDGDRITDSTYVLVDDGDNYRLLPQSVTKSVISGGSPSMYAKTAHTFDPTNRVAITDEMWVDSVDADRAITASAYDMTTGNLLARWKPEQNAGDGLHSGYTYDDRKLFIAFAGNELGQYIATSYDFGTGVKVLTQGPNSPACAATSSCPSGTPTMEQHQIFIDGLGRPLQQWETFSTDGITYSWMQIGAMSYVDSVVGNAPTSVTTQHLLDANANVWDHQETDLDGHGRPIKTTAFAQGSAPADAVTSYHYNNDGTLGSVSVPDPTGNNASSVTYTYTYDSLGRPTSMRRPDSQTNPSGVDLSYDGLQSTTTEYVGANGGQHGQTITTKDVFGRLVQVDELASTEPHYASTLYTYGPDDNVLTVTDPQGVTTSLTHDFAGRRTAVTRGSRTWTYVYDRNGNVTQQIVPGSSIQNDPAYTTQIAYDDLDRPISKTIGERVMSTDDQALLGGATEQFTYDDGVNGIGRLHTWSSFAPGGSQPQISLDLSYTLQGQPNIRTETINIAGLPSQTRSFAQSFYTSGMVASTNYGDTLQGVYTSSSVDIDARGLPIDTHVAGLSRSGCSNTDSAVVSMTRNVAGLVTDRQGTGGGSTVDSTWTYDKLGRVVNQLVTSNGGAPVAQQSIAYYGNDDPSVLDQYLGPSHKEFSFQFDTRHQLQQAIETTTSGAYFSANYSFGDAGRFATAHESTTFPPNSEVKPRDVSYSYLNSGPQAQSQIPPPATNYDDEEVLALVNNGSGSNYMSYDYDPAGNETMRCTGVIDYAAHTCSRGYWKFLYDGNDRLRRASSFDDAGGLIGSEEYWYDGSGNRVATVKRDASGNKTELIWWFADTEAHYDGTGTPTHTYSYVSLGTPVGRVDRQNDATCTSTGFEFQFHGLGSSTLATVDLSGNITSSFSYAPFGEIIEATGGVSTHRRRMNDKFVDELDDLAYYGARFYDKTMMGWTQGDPLYRFAPDARWVMPRRGNLYQFSLNNPLRYLDPDGRDPGGPHEQAPKTNRSPIRCNVNPAGCAIDADMSGTDGSDQAKGTATNQARDLVDMIVSGDMPIKLKQAQRYDTHGGGHPFGNIDLSDPGVQKFVELIYQTLANSSAVRELISQMLRGRNAVGLIYTRSGQSITTPANGVHDTDAANGHGANALIFFNPASANDFESRIGVGAAQGKPHEEDELPDAGLAHELEHAWEIQHGRWNGGDLREWRANAFENLYREQAGEFSRDCYFTCNGQPHTMSTQNPP